MYTPSAEVPSSSRKRQATQLQEDDWSQYLEKSPTGEQFGGYMETSQHQGYENGWMNQSWNYQQKPQQQQPLQEQPYYPDQEYHEFFGIPPPMAQIPVQYDHTQFQQIQHQPQPQQQLLPEPQQQLHHYPQQIGQPHYPNQYPQYDFQNIQTQPQKYQILPQQYQTQQHVPLNDLTPGLGTSSLSVGSAVLTQSESVKIQPQGFQNPPQQYQTQQQIPPNDSTPGLRNSSLSSVGSAASIQSGNIQPQPQDFQSPPQQYQKIQSETIEELEDNIKMPEVERKRQRKIMLKREFAHWWTRKETRKREYIGRRPNFDKMKDTDALEVFQGRLALVGNMTKYTLTVEEIRRRIEGAESMNITEVYCLFKKAKKKNGGDDLRRLLWDQYGIQFNISQRHSILQSKFTPILEGEARALANDVDNYTQKHFPREEIAQMIVESMHESDSPLEMRKIVQGALNTLIRIIEISQRCKPKTVGEIENKSGYEPLDDKMEFYSDRTHGFGIINMNTWFSEAFKTMNLVQGGVENQLAQQATVTHLPPLDQQFFKKH